ncbi:hypothetical protein SERLA73DRAFT_190547 [Serpula lacrymans var. lacrymans S7.3]|uniref:Xaa-Pro dipeptidyl-peptidase-like domain-containing protein n=2 Tax=Serpula lacrymans var. lacrymans TaxID=341189 RepID=F8QFT8_SERL3|nr:uncharacterized protein SERLADRAFT_444086 [Serpula lacrymans var. lacrymans S7.9]EGN92828.1 hypothetical protein SERLA73DRAFT_190547 [Serpula lacrymans var. lacrymans S7.3]EGO18503.1 hypothetical protein SERLADRAFT_444086 [Serpula lacrymans var. lacrymans S7.9]
MSCEPLKITSIQENVKLDVWFYRPDKPGPYPVVVAGHGLTVIKDAGYAAFAQQWAEGAGWASLIFDYRGFGDSDGEPRNVVGFESQLQDYRSVIEWASSQADFIAEKIVVMGSAWSGLQVADLVVNDGRLAGGMAHCPVLDARATVTSVLPRPKLLFWACIDYLRGKLGFRPIFLRAVGKPGEFAVLNSPSSYAGFTSMFAQGRTPFDRAPNLISPRFITEALSCRPGLALKKALCPMLVVSAEEDDIVPIGITRDIVANADKRVKLVNIRCGHYEIMAGGKGYEANINAQINFLQNLSRIDQH